MKQRLGIALALLHQPKLLILDEPMNGLDPQGIRETRALLQTLPEQSGVTVFLSSHLLSEVELIATHIGILNQGELLFQGTLKALQSETKNFVSFHVDNQEKAREILQQRNVSGPVSESDQQMVVVHVHSQQETAEMTRRLVEEGIAVYSVIPQPFHLEDLFFRYAGRK
jgi:ABC-2 type transport system ATP-binding protein